MLMGAGVGWGLLWSRWGLPPQASDWLIPRYSCIVRRSALGLADFEFRERETQSRRAITFGAWRAGGVRK